MPAGEKNLGVAIVNRAKVPRSVVSTRVKVLSAMRKELAEEGLWPELPGLRSWS